MSENKQKGKSTTGKSKYAIKKALQNSGHFSPTSPFQSTRAQKEEAKGAEPKA
jgi:hypothetical protein